MFVRDIVVVRLYHNEKFYVLRAIVLGLQPLDFMYNIRKSKRMHCLTKAENVKLNNFYLSDIMGCPSGEPLL